MTLADWAAWYDCSGKPFAKPSDEVDVDDLPTENFIDDDQNEDEDIELSQKLMLAVKLKRDLKPE